MAFNGAYPPQATAVLPGMIAQVMFVIFASGLIAQQTDWVAAGNRAWEKGSPEEAAADFAHALDARAREGASATDLLRLRVTLATAYMEAGEYRETEAVLQEAQKTAWQLRDVPRAELLNAWSSLHLKLGQLSAAERELQEARRSVMKIANPGDILPTVLHNLAAVEMRTGAFTEALGNEGEAVRLFEKSLPPDHPTIIRGWASMASLQYMAGQPQNARKSIECAIASAERTYGPAHRMLADLLESEAIIFDKLKLRKKAKLARKRAREIRGAPAPAAQDMTWSLREPLAPDVRLLSK
jgi:tetratricopeptide (TPR) repeat protein